MQNYLLFGRFLGCSIVMQDVSMSPALKNPISYTANPKIQWLIFTP